MTRTRSTKSALLTSILALFLCFTMLLGTTFAWFTDSVSSANNIIQSGNLDVELEYYNGDSKSWEKVTATTNVFEENTLWEPGHTEVVYLKVSNLGSLALKYQLSINVADEQTSLTEAGEKIRLSDIIEFGAIDGVETPYADRDAALAAVKESAVLSTGYSKLGEIKAGEPAQYVALVVYMPKSVGNEANHAKGAAAPRINLGINLLATQLTAESDSFNGEYDAGAALPWSGKIDTEWYDATKTEYVLYTAEELAGLAELVNNGNSFSGKIVKLGTDLDLAKKAWTPIGSCNTQAYFQGTFDGQGYTVYGLNVDRSTDPYKYSTAGLFGWVDAAAATVKNLTLDHATVKGSHWVGAVAGYFTGTIQNCTVTNSTVAGFNVNADANGDKVGGIVGYMNTGAGLLDGNTVTKSSVTGYRDVAAIAGSVATTNTVTNNKADTVVLTYSADYVGELVSPKTAVTVDATNVATNVTIVKAVAATTPDDFAGALNGYDNEIKDKNISIVLNGDLKIAIGDLGQQTGGSGEYKLGTTETETITIDLNGYCLTIETGYWSAIGAQNPNAVFTIKNGSMTSVGNSANTWNAWDLRLCNCNYVIENVTFKKAVALDNAGKSTTMKNVTITDTHNADTYALWITSEGQTVDIDGLTIDMMAATDGRGIKIDNQYVDTSSKVTLNIKNATFKTEEKAAILVKTPAGADITLENVNIENVKADHVNTVWVDSDAADYADKVTVTGGAVAVEGTGVVTNANELAARINAGETDIKLAGGTYVIPTAAQGKTLTLTGVGDTVINVNGTGGENCDYGFDGSTVTLKDLTITTNSSTYIGYARMNGTYENCTFEGTYTLYGNSKFTGCTFNVAGDVYNIWTWGAPTATFEKCTFNSDGKAVLLYGRVNTELTVDTCTFNDNGGLTDLKAAIEIGNDYGTSYKLVVNNTTVNGYEINDKGISTGTTLWGNKNSMGTDKLNVVVDGVDVY